MLGNVGLVVGRQCDCCSGPGNRVSCRMHQEASIALPLAVYVCKIDYRTD